MADLFNISVRTGCFCNSGSCQRHLKASNKDMKDMYKAGHKCGDEIDLVNGRPTGAVRVSFGYYNTYQDVDKLVVMICRCFVKTKIKKPKRSKIRYQYVEAKKIVNEESVGLLKEQFFKKVDILEDSPMFESEIKVNDIAIFPIKSCGAFKINSAWKIGSKGFEYDREWMIVKDNGVCLTQKQNTRMCLIKPFLDLKRRLLILNCKGKYVFVI
jgi:molybdenum cofactor sulfurtransferase